MTDSTARNLESYYRFHSVIYDFTRWTFLFGRRSLIDTLPNLPSNPRIMEVGCGTGNNLLHLQSAFPSAYIYGIDLSSDMLNKAKEKVDRTRQIYLTKNKYGTDELKFKPFDLILLSYSITLMSDQLGNILGKVREDLKAGGFVAVVDFHQTPFKSFRKWMKFNHVNMNGATLPMLSQLFTCRHQDIQKAYGGLWTYFQFIGQRDRR